MGEDVATGRLIVKIVEISMVKIQVFRRINEYL